MANNNDDITIKIDVDTSDVDKSFKDMEKTAKSSGDKIVKTADKIEDAYEDVEDQLKDIQALQKRIFSNINISGLTNAMNEIINTVSKAMQQCSKEIQQAINQKGSVDIKTNITGGSNESSSSSSGGMVSGVVGATAVGATLVNTFKDVKKEINSSVVALNKVKIIDDVVISAKYLADTFTQIQYEIAEATGEVVSIGDVIDGINANAKDTLSIFEKEAVTIGDVRVAYDNLLDIVENFQLAPVPKNQIDTLEILNKAFAEYTYRATEAGYALSDNETLIPPNIYEPLVKLNKGLIESTQGFNKLKVVGTDALLNLKEKMREVIENNKILGTAINGVKPFITSLKKSMQGLANTKVGQTFSKISKSAKQYIPQASKVVDNLTNKLENYINKVKKASSATQSSTKGMASGFKGALKSLLPIMSVISIFSTLKDSVKNAMDATEGQSMFDAVFGDSANKMDAFVQKMNQTLGLSVNGSKQFTATIAQMGRAMGMSSNSAMDMSQKMLTLAGDMSAFYNVDIAQAQEDLQSALSGSNEVLTKYGIVLREDTIQQYAYANGIATVGSELTSAQRAMTLTLMVEKQLGQANGALAREFDSPAGRARRLSIALAELKTSLGNIVMPIWNAVMPGLIALANALTVVFNKIASVVSGILSLFGLGVKGSSGGGIISDTFTDLSDTFGDVADSSGVIADNFSEANKDVKQMSKSLASFDKLNVLNTNKSSSGSSGSTGSNGSIGIPTIGSMGGNAPSYNNTSVAVQGVNKWAKQIYDAIVNNPYFKSLKSNFFGLVDACKSFIKSAGGWLKLFMDSGGREFLNNLGECALIIADILVAALKDGVKWITNFLNSAKGQAVIKSLAEMCKWLSEKLKDVLLWIRENKDMLYKLIGIIASVKLGFSAFIKVAQGISKIKTGIGLLKTALGKLPTVLKAIKSGWETMQIVGLLALDKIKLAFPGVLAGAKTMLSSAVSAIGSAVSAVAGAIGISSGALVAIVLAVIAVLALVILNWDKVKEWGIKAWNGIKSAWSASNQWCYNNIVSPMINHFRNMFNKVRDLGQRAFDGIKNTWQGMSSWYGTLGQRVSEHFSNMWNSIKNGGNSAWQYLQRVFNTGGSFFRDITSGMGNAFKSVLNSAIKGINNIIGIPFRGINSAIRSLKNTSILGARPFSFLREISVPKIPYLATGGIVDKATLAMIGEGKQNEAVIPLDTLWKQLDKQFDKQNKQLSKGNNQPITVQVVLDGKIVAQNTVNQFKDMNRRGVLDTSWL